MAERARLEGVDLVLAARSDLIAGDRLSPAVRAGLLAAIENAMMLGDDWNTALALSPRWQLAARAKLISGECLPKCSRGELSATARHLLERLSRYARTHFASDRHAPDAIPRDRAQLYRLMMRTGGQVPSVRTLRKWLSAGFY